MPVTAQMSPAAASASSKRLRAWVAENLGHPELLALAVAVDAQRAVALANAAREDAPDGHVTEVVVVVQGGHVHGQRRVDVGGRRGDLFHHQVEQWRKVAPLVAERADRVTLAAEA